MSISGDTVAAGAPFDDHAGDVGYFEGSVYVFTRSGTTWTEQDKLIASDPARWDMLGLSVAISGDTVVVGNNGDDEQTGSAYVYTRSGNIWSVHAKLIASDANDHDKFGYSPVAIDGDTVVVAAQGDDDRAQESGSVYIFDVSSNTPEGNTVEVSDTSGTTVTFTDVTSSGETTVTVTEAGPNPPSGFKLVPSDTYYQITTTATYTGTITICINYDDSGLQQDRKKT
ncbi:MAG: hypothetical protein ACXAEU_16370 [Candidatus Hodarchaeales archaeon]